MTTMRTIVWLLIVVCAIQSFLLAQQIPQPQPRLEIDPEQNWSLIELDNGSQWYFDEEKLVAIWAVPEQEWEDNGGIKVVLIGTGFRIHLPMTVQEIDDRIVPGKPKFKVKGNENED